jgi:hypothetical protein
MYIYDLTGSSLFLNTFLCDVLDHISWPERSSRTNLLRPSNTYINIYIYIIIYVFHSRRQRPIDTDVAELVTDEGVKVDNASLVQSSDSREHMHVDDVWQRLDHEKLVSFQLHGSHISQVCVKPPQPNQVADNLCVSTAA